MHAAREARLHLERFREAVRRARQDDGLPGALRVAVRLVHRQLRRPFALLRGYRFDRRHGVHTRGWQAPDPQVTARSTHGDGTAYEPTPASECERLLESLREVRPSETTFVDLGCGKGLTLAVAAMKGFRRIVGVELDERLARVAQSNAASVESRTGSDIDVVTGDVTAYRFPAGPLLIYLYNPFGAATMASVVRSLVASLEEDPRPVHVLYVHPLHRSVWDEAPCFAQIRAGGQRWVLYGPATAKAQPARD